MNFKFLLKYSLAGIISLIPFAYSVADSDLDNSNTDTEETGYYDLILKVDVDDPDTDIQFLRDNGIIVPNHRGEICLTFVPENLDIDAVLENLPSLRPDDEVANANRSKTVRSVQKARRLNNIRNSVRRAQSRKRNTLIHNTTAMNMNRHNFDLQSTLLSPEVSSRFPELTGKGVVVGFNDIGFDARHINFRNADGSQLRVKKAVQVKESEGSIEIYETPEDILAWHTDTDDNFHATHVAGILTGGYTVNDMHGIAPAADIVATTSELTDCGILAGIEEVISYAKAVGKPAVINLSLANYTGPHDGSSLFCQYLDRCAEDAVICVASGNEGNINASFSTTLTSQKDYIMLEVESTDWVHFNVSGMTDIYGQSADPITISLMVLSYPVKTANIHYQTPKLDFTKRSQYILTSDISMKDVDGYIYSDAFAEAMSGEVLAYGEVDPENGRYHVTVIYDTVTERKASDKYNWAHYYTGIKAWGTPGERIDAFADGIQSRFGYISGYTPRPGSMMSVNDLATGHNVVSVGAYVGREEVANLGGGVWGAGLTPMDICDYSGYGTLIDGRVLPLTIAPGVPLVSSLSGAYIHKYQDESLTNLKVGESKAYPTTNIDDKEPENNPDDNMGDIIGNDDDNDVTEEIYHYWGPYGGTSMASPYAAGFIALLQQINPDLTSAEVIERIKQSNDSENHPYSANPRNGQGYLNTSKMLLNLIKDIPTSVETMTDGKMSYMTSVDAEKVHILNPAQHDLTIEIFTPTGLRLSTTGYTDTKEITHDITGLPSGILLIHITSPTAESRTLKIAR